MLILLTKFKQFMFVLFLHTCGIIYISINLFIVKLGSSLQFDFLTINGIFDDICEVFICLYAVLACEPPYNYDIDDTSCDH